MNTLLHDCKNELRKLALKATPARLAVLELLENRDKPVDVETITSYLKTNNIKVDPVTAFRIMNAFTDKGLAKRIQLNEGKFRYELADQKDHHHLICENCGKVENIEDPIIPKFEEHINKKHNFAVKRHSLEFFGVCRQCQ